jgi:hypothetical protein
LVTNINLEKHEIGGTLQVPGGALLADWLLRRCIYGTLWHFRMGNNLTHMKFNRGIPQSYCELVLVGALGKLAPCEVRGPINIHVPIVEVDPR